MKTVKEYLQEVDSEKLISVYLYDNPILLYEISDETMTVKEVKELAREKLQKYIKRLLTMEVEASEDGKQYALFAHKCLKDQYEEEDYSLVCLQELRNKDEEVTTYAYEFTKQAEVMGFMVSDAKFTQKHIYGLLADVLYETSFFGFEQQHLNEEILKLDEAIKEVNEGTVKYRSYDVFGDELGLERREDDEVGDVLKRKANVTVEEFNKYYKQKELRKLMDLWAKDEEL